MIWMEKEVFCNEDDISAEEENQSQGAWIPCKNGYSRWKKGSGCQKSEGQKVFDCVMAAAGFGSKKFQTDSV